MAGNWADLRTRTLSGVVMAAVGAGAVVLGGVAFQVLIVVLGALMVWETARMAAPAAPRVQTGLAVLQGFGLAAAVLVDSPYGAAFALAAPLTLAWFATELRIAAPLYALGTGLAVLVLGAARETGGWPVVLWLVVVVAASDIGGYFVGRALGGPKFWPRVSPKKTWSGTIAGWVGAYLVALLFAALHDSAPAPAIAPLVAFAGQMGDIAESGLKRRAGVKDSSNLIPGHGGVLDRFDALIGAALLVMALHLVFGRGLL